MKKQGRFRLLLKSMSNKSKPEGFNDDWEKSGKTVKIANAFVPIKSFKEKYINTKERLNRAKGVFYGFAVFFKGLFDYALETKEMLFNPAKRPDNSNIVNNFTFDEQIAIARQMLVLVLLCLVVFMAWVYFVKTYVSRTGRIPLFSISHVILIGVVVYAYSYYRGYVRYSGKLRNVIRGFLMFYLSDNDASVILLDNPKDCVSSKGKAMMRVANGIIVVLTIVVLFKVVRDSFFVFWGMLGADILIMEYGVLVLLMFFLATHYRNYRVYR